MHALNRNQVEELLRGVENAVAADPEGSFQFDSQGFARLTVGDRSWAAGRFETPSIAELRQRAAALPAGGAIRLSVLQGCSPEADIGALQARSEPASLFQVASQFNTLEAPSPRIVNVREYVSDPTQGPRASVSAFPGTFLRHYQAPSKHGRFVQRRGACLNLLAEALTGTGAEVRDGYLSSDSIADASRLAGQLEERFESIRIGLHEGVEVALGGNWGGPVPTPPARIAQVFTSTLALGGYSSGVAPLRAACRPLLRAAYLGALLSACCLRQKTVVLTMIGGGVFGNPAEEISRAILWALAEADASAPAGMQVFVNLWSARLDAALEGEARRRGGEVTRL